MQQKQPYEKKWNVLQLLSQSPDLSPFMHAFHLVEPKLKGSLVKS